MTTKSTIESFISDKLIDADGYLSPEAVFSCSAVLYQTPLTNSFVQSVIDGSSRAASFPAQSIVSPYEQMITTINALANNELAFAFYGRNPDNALSVLSWVRECTPEQACHTLVSFEIAPAEEGGVSWLGMTGKSMEWLLLHELDPGELFTITAYGAPQFCLELASSLGIEHLPADNAV